MPSLWRSFLAAATLISGAAAVDIALYAYNYCSSGNILYCDNIDQGVCCYTNKFYFFSVRYNNMPDVASTVGRTYLGKTSPSGYVNRCGQLVSRVQNFRNPCFTCYSPGGSTCAALGGGYWVATGSKRDLEDNAKSCNPVEASMMQLDNHNFRVLGDHVPEEITEAFFELFKNETIQYADIPIYLLNYEEPQEA